ncbi:MAG: type IV toxin-antitoxin system AbiEi family antitoxin [Vicinamibacteria bacterium]
MNDLTLRGLVLDRKDGRTIPDRQALVALWVPAYVEALRPKLKERRFRVQGDDRQQLWARLAATLAAHEQPWVLTGAAAAERRTHFFRAEETEIHAPVRAFEDRDVQKDLVAQPAVRGGNLVVIEPPGPLAIRPTVRDAIPAAPDLLVYAELRYRGTGQALEAAELLLPKVLDEVTH